LDSNKLLKQLSEETFLAWFARLKPIRTPKPQPIIIPPVIIRTENRGKALPMEAINPPETRAIPNRIAILEV
jgi:hypothetical protein